jgi:hypothetical protein
VRERVTVGRNRFFFEKKTQTTFVVYRRHYFFQRFSECRANPQPEPKSFLLLFFKKEALAFAHQKMMAAQSVDCAAYDIGRQRGGGGMRLGSDAESISTATWPNYNCQTAISQNCVISER